MRFSILLCGLGMLGALPASAQSQRSVTSGPATVPSQPAPTRSAVVFSDGFEGSTVDQTPVGWVVTNVNGDAFQWKAISSVANAARIHTGDFAAAVFWNTAAAADDWMISPGFALTAGTQYEVSFWFLPGDGTFGTAESLELAIGQGQTVAAMTTTLLDINDEPASVEGSYQERTATFTPTASGTYSVGFHCNSPADQYFCAVDDVSVESTGGTATGDEPQNGEGMGFARPNPTAGTFRLSMTLNTAEAVRVSVYDALGREVAVLHDGALAAGETLLDGNTARLPAGVYSIRAAGESFYQTRMLTVTR